VEYLSSYLQIPLKLALGRRLPNRKDREVVYDPAKYAEGTTVQIAPLDTLEEFQRSWTLHNKLQPSQLDFAGRAAKIKRNFMYHGGDVLYELEDIPGIWHESCLEPVK
jgi:hypothetical protein